MGYKICNGPKPSRYLNQQHELPEYRQKLGGRGTPDATERSGRRSADTPPAPRPARLRDMLARVRSAAVLGVDAYLVDVEVDLASGLPSFSTVGLPHGAVREGRERVGAAIVNAGFQLPLKRITVNLAPADIRKEGSALDLPIALAILVASGQLPAQAL